MIIYRIAIFLNATVLRFKSHDDDDKKWRKIDYYFYFIDNNHDYDNVDE